jgi:hypothetical protein
VVSEAASIAQSKFRTQWTSDFVRFELSPKAVRRHPGDKAWPIIVLEIDWRTAA